MKCDKCGYKAKLEDMYLWDNDDEINVTCPECDNMMIFTKDSV